MLATAVISWAAVAATFFFAPVASAQPQDTSSQFRFKPQIPKRVGGEIIWLDAAVDKTRTLDTINVQLKTVVVSPGDTLSATLTRNKLRNDLATQAAIQDLNPTLKDINRLEPDQAIRVPNVDGVFQTPTLGLPSHTRFPTATIVHDPLLTQEAISAIDQAKSRFDAYRQTSGHSRFTPELELRMDRAIDAAELLKSYDLPFSREKRLLLKDSVEILAVAAKQKETGRGPYPVQHLDYVVGMASDNVWWLGGWFGDNSSDPLPVVVETVGRVGQANAAAPTIDGLTVCIAPGQPLSSALKNGTPYNPECTQPLSDLPSSPVRGTLAPNVYAYWVRKQNQRVSCFHFLTVAQSRAADLTRLSVQSDLESEERAQCYGG